MNIFIVKKAQMQIDIFFLNSEIAETGTKAFSEMYEKFTILSDFSHWTSIQLTLIEDFPHK